MNIMLTDPFLEEESDSDSSDSETSLSDFDDDFSDDPYIIPFFWPSNFSFGHPRIL